MKLIVRMEFTLVALIVYSQKPLENLDHSLLLTVRDTIREGHHVLLNVPSCSPLMALLAYWRKYSNKNANDVWRLNKWGFHYSNQTLAYYWCLRYSMSTSAIGALLSARGECSGKTVYWRTQSLWLHRWKCTVKCPEWNRPT